MVTGGLNLKEYGLYINGQWVKSDSGKTFETRSPINGEVLATFPSGTKADVNRAIDAAEAAYPKWRKTPPPKRGEILLRAAQILRQRKQEVGELVTKEMGKVIAEGKGDVQEAIDFLEYISGEGRRLLGETTPSELPEQILHDRAPADWRRRLHHALELPDGDPHLEDRRGADLRQLRLSSNPPA